MASPKDRAPLTQKIQEERQAWKPQEDPEHALSESDALGAKSTGEAVSGHMSLREEVMILHHISVGTRSGSFEKQDH